MSIDNHDMGAKKKAILEAFQHMDIPMLELLLDDKSTYQEAEKGLFLNKLSETFENFRENGDTLLIPKRGKCLEEKCPNLGCRGYSFLGDVSNNHLDLIFEETANDITDIYHCNGFLTEHPTALNKMVSITVFDDEKADFKPDFDYWMLAKKCTEACEEIKKEVKEGLTKEFFLLWLEKHGDAYEEIGNPPYDLSRLQEFYSLFEVVAMLGKFLQSEKLVNCAVEEYDGEYFSWDEKEHILWLCKYEKLGLFLPDFRSVLIPPQYPWKVPILDHPELLFDMKDFQPFLEFSLQFEGNYWDFVSGLTKRLEIMGKIIISKDLPPPLLLSDLVAELGIFNPENEENHR